MTEQHQYEPDSESLSFPDDTVVGIVDDPDAANAVIRDLVSAGIHEEDIHLLCCEEGSRRLDPDGERHGTLGRLKRIVQNFGDKDRDHVSRQADELRAGNFLIAAPAETEEERDRLAAIMSGHGGHFIIHYTSWTVTQVAP